MRTTTISLVTGALGVNIKAVIMSEYLEKIPGSSVIARWRE